MKKCTNGKIAALGIGIVLTAGGTPAFSVTPEPATTDNKGSFELSAGTEMMGGDITYQIGFPLVSPTGVVYDGYFPFSELAWPLDVWLGRIDGRATINDQWRLNATIKKDLSTPGDNMEDSDWVTPSDPSRLDIFSESEISSFDAVIFDADVEWSFFRRENFSLYTGIGYLYQNFDYDAKPLYQYSPSGLPGYDYTGDGRVGITYEMTYSIPYLKLGGDLKVSQDFTLEGSIAYSPIVQAEDTDNHLLREYGGKISTGDMEGDSFMLDVSGRYAFTPSLFMEAGFQLTKIEVDGDQAQRYGIGFQLDSVTEEAESTQTSGFISVGYSF
jgi:outer membrane protease